MTTTNRQFLIVARPQGWVKESDFEYHEEPVPELEQGQFLIETTYLSIDPTLRGQMDNRADYAAPLELGDVMHAGGSGTVVKSLNPDFPVGSQVMGSIGMQSYHVAGGEKAPFRIFDKLINPADMMSIFGGTGMTAYFGLLDVGQPRSGDTLVISGAAGATGNVVGQIGKIKGCRVVGIAGSDEKCEWLKTIGFDETINYKTENVPAMLDQYCPNGINIYFDNVGGEILDHCLARLAMNARVVLCGGISQYNKQGPMTGPANYFNLIVYRAKMEGFLVLDYLSRFGEAMVEMQGWMDEGKLVNKVHIFEGFEQLPAALIGMFNGENTGKTLVRVSDLS